MKNFAIAGVQMYVHYGHDNMDVMEAKLSALMVRFPWVEMVLFSELAAYGPSLAHAQTLPGPAEERFCSWAKKYGLWLIPGSLFEKVGDQIFNTASVINPKGEVIGRYRKMFPFYPYEQGVEPGTEFMVFDVPNAGRFGLSICYDMWMPETTRTLAAMGAEVILHPSLTNTIDRNIELSIACASAATNQVFFFDINGVGGGGYGRSIIVRPTGNVIYEAGNSEELMPVDINFEAVRRGRSSGLYGLGQPLKSFRDRKADFSIYQPDGPGRDYLAGLGPLEAPKRPDRGA